VSTNYDGTFNDRGSHSASRPESAANRVLVFQRRGGELYLVIIVRFRSPLECLLDAPGQCVAAPLATPQRRQQFAAVRALALRLGVRRPSKPSQHGQPIGSNRLA
jgi:hypothetical protein